MKLGFIGCGNMAKAMIKGIIASGAIAPGEIYGSNVTPEHAAAVAEEFGINTGTNNITVAENADILFLSVKPYQYETVIAEIRGAMRPEQTVVTIAPGKTIAWLEEHFGTPVRIVRTAPNTPAHVLAGVTAYCPNSLATAEDVAAVECLLASFGTTVELEESQLDAASAIARLCIYVHRGLSRRRRGRRPEAPAGLPACRAGRTGCCKTRARIRQASWPAEGRGVLAFRIHHPRP